MPSAVEMLRSNFINREKSFGTHRDFYILLILSEKSRKPYSFDTQRYVYQPLAVTLVLIISLQFFSGKRYHSRLIFRENFHFLTDGISVQFYLIYRIGIIYQSINFIFIDT